VGKDHDHDTLTVYLHLKFKFGGEQAFGNCCMDNEDQQQDFVRDVCETFGVHTKEELIGLDCFALRSWNRLSRRIEGLESGLIPAKRFTINHWGKKHWPTTPSSPLQARIDEIQRDIRWSLDRTRQALDDLLTVEEGYVDWANPEAKLPDVICPRTTP
jgi:hypothetical protein